MQFCSPKDSIFRTRAMDSCVITLCKGPAMNWAFGCIICAAGSSRWPDRSALRRAASAAGPPWHAWCPSRHRPWRDCRRLPDVPWLHSDGARLPSCAHLLPSYFLRLFLGGQQPPEWQAVSLRNCTIGATTRAGVVNIDHRARRLDVSCN